MKPDTEVVAEMRLLAALYPSVRIAIFIILNLTALF